MSALNGFLRERREAAHLSQAQLAECVNVTRQALIAIEAGRQVPSTTLALSLAQALGCAVEDLFKLADPGALEVRLAPGFGTGRVALGYVDGACVAHHITGDASAADGIILKVPGRNSGKTLVQSLVDAAAISQNYFVAGCAPLLGPLAARVNARFRDQRFTWLPCNNSTAMRHLRDGLLHVAGLHGGSDMPHALLRKTSKANFIIVNLLKWRQGLIFAPGNPRGIHEPSDLLRPKLRVAWREEGSGTHALTARLLVTKKIPFQKIPAPDHGTVASLIRIGAADAGIAIESAARAMGLDFIPLAEERFDLVMHESFAETAVAQRLIDTLAQVAFKREGASYCCDMSLTGQSRVATAA